MSRKRSERSYAPGRTRRLLLDAALDLFAEHGFSRTAMQDVVERAGMTKGAFYHHFNTKDDALRELHDEFLDRVTAALGLALDRYTTPTEQLAQIAYDVAMVCIIYQKHVAVFFRDQRALDEDVRRPILERRRAFTRSVRDVVRAGIERGEFSAHLDPDTAALGVLGMAIWTYQWYRPDGSRSAEELAQQVSGMALAALGARTLTPVSVPAKVDTVRSELSPALEVPRREA